VTPVLLPDNPRAILAALKLDGFQQQAIAEAVLEIYGRNPPESLTSGKLGKDLEARHKVKTAEARARGAAPPHKPAGWDARKAFTAAFHSWRAKTGSMIADDILRHPGLSGFWFPFSIRFPVSPYGFHPVFESGKIPSGFLRFELDPEAV